MNNGIKPINRVVDMLAYVTLITSVPTAVYDANKIKNQLKIQLAPKPTTIVGINKNTYHLTNQDLVVSCEGQILSIAGIIGNEAFAITDNTKDIIIEVANFNHLLIRNSANRLSLHTNAANRFAKPISNYLIFLTLHFIYQQFAGYAISQPNINIKPREQKVVDIDVNLINQLLDTSLTIPVIQQNLKYYGFVAKDNALVVPPYRLDITTSQDLSEEITKFLVINEITPKPVNGDLTKDNNNTVYRLYSKLEDILAVNYFSQVKTYNLVSETDLSNFNIFKYTNFIKITNANNQSRQYLRTNLIHNLLKVYEFNLSYKTPIQPIFEIQNIYTSKTYKNLTLLTPSVKFINRLNDSKIKYDINVLRGIVDLIANVFNAKFDYFTSLDNPYFYPNEMLTINFAGQLIGYIGLIKTSELKPYGLNDQLIYGVTINLEMLFDLYTPPQIQFSPINDLMPIYKDISFYVSPTTRINNALATIKKLPFVQHYDFIDRFVNQKGEISYTIRFELINTKNLKAIEIDQYYQQIISILIEFNCVVRR
jgi:phenylalanyl-tRNA synthetase beta chain